MRITKTHNSTETGHRLCVAAFGLGFYFMAKATRRDAFPFFVIGSAVGSLLCDKNPRPAKRLVPLVPIQ
ncbi:hypothetical protein FUAX_09750 [Fulvitalea axinellae]|uniref:MICOS complex subunit MIC10 n=1 Tax=Fulvitalea axinellae TaxID=1182444 RepID=A0AAU9CY08_9BACT|nr:hypothetical protein FUAX_09750 [Fulvitalea axinellae]